MRREGRVVAVAIGEHASAGPASREPVPDGPRAKACPAPGALASGGGAVIVELSPSACARCARGRGCGAALFSPSVSGPGATSALRLSCDVPAGGQTVLVGDRVGVELDGRNGQWLPAVLLVYTLPTAGLLGGALFPEPWTPFTAIGGVLGGILAWRLPGAKRLLDVVAGPCPTSARIVSVEPQEPRCQASP